MRPRPYQPCAMAPQTAFPPIFISSNHSHPQSLPNRAPSCFFLTANAAFSSQPCCSMRWVATGKSDEPVFSHSCRGWRGDAPVHRRLGRHGLLATWGRHGRPCPRQFGDAMAAHVQPPLMKCCNPTAKCWNRRYSELQCGARHTEFCWIRQQKMLQPVARDVTTAFYFCFDRLPEFCLLRIFCCNWCFVLLEAANFFASTG